MEPSTIVPLWPDGSAHNAGEERPCLEVYLPTDYHAPRPAVVVCPGGGYARRAPHEGAPFAELFAAHGMVGLVCHYRVGPGCYPRPMIDAARALRLTRHHAEAWGIDPTRVALMGFSAGGHLAATVATRPDLVLDPDDDLAGAHSARPDRVILAYAVLSMVANAHQGSVHTLLGDQAPADLRELLSNERHVNAGSPPAFLFHTADDPSVPVANSILYAQACAAHGVPVELHVYESGRHGVGLAFDSPRLASWSGLLMDWLSDWWLPLEAPTEEVDEHDG